MTLVRRETKRGHTYALDGRPVKGVTTLLSGGLPKPQLVYWSAKTVAEYVADNPDAVEVMRSTMGRESMVAALKGVPWDKRDEAAARGTDIHALADRIIHGEAVEVPEHLAGAVEGYVRWLDAWQITPVLTERPCASREWLYAGTFDAVLTFGAGELAGQTWLCDWKTSKAAYGDSAAQLAAYANSDFFLAEDGSEQPMPLVSGLAIVHITPTGTDLYPVTDPAHAWKCFKHIQFVAKQVDAIKGALGEPVPAPNGLTNRNQPIGVPA